MRLIVQPYMEVNGAPELLFPTFFRISSFVISRTKTFIKVWNYLTVSKLWQNFQFWVNYPFNIIYEAKACISDTHQGRQRGRDGMIQIKKQLQGWGIQKGCRWEKSHKVMLEFNMNTRYCSKGPFEKKCSPRLHYLIKNSQTRNSEIWELYSFLF